MGTKALWTKINPPPKKKVVKRIRKVSKKRTEQLKAYASLRKDYLKNHPICQRCHVFESVDIHHCKGKTNLLLLDVRHWKALCRQDHKWVHDHPDAARREGLICEKGKWNSHD